MVDIIHILNLRKSFLRDKEVQLVLEIPDLVIHKNEFVSLVGASGCGKTTLLNILAGFIPFDSGNIKFFGKTNLKPGADRACVFQEDAVFPWMTVKDNIGYGLNRKNINTVRKNEIITHYLNLVNLENDGCQYPKQLSGGMRKRVDLARAMANSPDTILMDEPFGALDYRTRKDLQDRFIRILEIETKTIIFVTHDISEALYLSDRVIILSQSPGRILSDIKVPFSKPRSRSICDTPQFISLRNKIETIILSNVNE
jgi:ABC-type nitrate/sulfonate/bicarbonate transport system ATPase subunit